MEGFISIATLEASCDPGEADQKVKKGRSSTIVTVGKELGG
jgi:hypothetical protein